MTENLFGSTPATTADAGEDLVMKALREMKLGGGGAKLKLPEGDGIYEIEKLAFGRSKFNNSERLTIRFKCVHHDTKPDAVGQPFEKDIYYQATGNQPFQMVMSAYAQYLLYPFGAGAKQALETKAQKLLDVIKRAYDERFTKIVETQALEGAGTYAGKRLAIRVLKKTVKKFDAKTQAVVDKVVYNDYPDVAPAV